MRAFICTDHDGHNPVGVASVVVAENEFQARELLNAELKSEGLEPRQGGYRNTAAYTLIELDLTTARAYVLNNGDY